MPGTHSPQSRLFKNIPAKKAQLLQVSRNAQQQRTPQQTRTKPDKAPNSDCETVTHVNALESRAGPGRGAQSRGAPEAPRARANKALKVRGGIPRATQRESYGGRGRLQVRTHANNPGPLALCPRVATTPPR